MPPQPQPQPAHADEACADDSFLNQILVSHLFIIFIKIRINALRSHLECLFLADASTPMSTRNFPPSFWNSNYVHPVTATTHPQVRRLEDSKPIYNNRLKISILFLSFSSGVL